MRKALLVVLSLVVLLMSGATVRAQAPVPGPTNTAAVGVAPLVQGPVAPTPTAVPTQVPVLPGTDVDVAPPEAPQPEGGNETQIAFSSGYACGGRPCYSYQLLISGYNQYNNYVTWNSGWKNPPWGHFNAWNWWWKPDRGIYLQFYINGYGWRHCGVYATKPIFGYRRWMHVQYEGNYSCSYYFTD